MRYEIIGHTTTIVFNILQNKKNHKFPHT